MDILCHDISNGKMWIYYGANDGYSVVGYDKPKNWCSKTGASLYIGDFNGDSRDDVLCHVSTGHVYIAFIDSFGNVTTGWDKEIGFCKSGLCRLFVGDFNGDKKADLLYHDGECGDKWIVYATAKGNFQDARIWYKTMEWCHGWHQTLYIGDFNGDNRSDMLCYDDVTGTMYTAYANWGGSFDEPYHANSMGWCTGRSCSLSVARVSRDLRDDLVCHCKSPSTEALRVRFPASDDGFETFRQWRGADSWCKKTTETLVVGPLKPGHCASLVCIDKVTGQYSIAFP